MILRIAWRSLGRHRRRTIVTIVTIGFGLAFLVFMVSLGEGAYAQLVHDAVRMQAGHVTLEHPEYEAAPAVGLRIGGVEAIRREVARLPAVERTKLLVLGQGVVRTGSGAVGVAVMGVEPGVERRTSPIARHVIAGEFLAGDGEARALVGSLLAERLRLAPGKKLVLTSNDTEGNLVEGLFRVSGIFETGADEMDGFLVQIPIDPARRLYGFAADEATRLGVVLDDPGAADRVLRRIRPIVGAGPVAVRPWNEVLAEVAAFIRLDRSSNLTFQGLLLVLVLFTIYNTLLMSVLERDREHAVLLALGTPPRRLRAQIVAEAAILAVLGCALGLALGGGGALWTSVHGLDLSALQPEGTSVSGFVVSTTIYARLEAWALLGSSGLLVAATMLLSLLTARRATQVPVVETLREGTL